MRNPSSGESANFWFLSADSGGSRSRIRDDLAQQSDLISLGVPGCKAIAKSIGGETEVTRACRSRIAFDDQFSPNTPIRV